MVSHDVADQPQRSQLAAQPIADHRVLLHQGELLDRERGRLEEQCVGDADLADVVQVAAAIERREIFGRQVQRGTERDGIVRQPLAMAVGGRPWLR